ncbi:hypothetical protein EPUS_01473 [Endocarpon pusillum Z07020]|uniref:Uncharacterized protein n=1 Tax=Endocarpon pusillum (strain Z07020 / HMAS-L-300199) TaxID=1263415 RepID=U1I2G5_ENDPU|nr:uncharacterized protein EPUS_01473 [Endocarpon pusillum Z07020]ERF76139.1 hypothetical protein EPUS_01473 [Endocarpon pusillum Z07020]
MAKHSRGKSRGSLSIFSLDAIRSRGWAGSRQACRLLEDDDQPKNLQIKPDQMHSAAQMADPLLRPLSPTPASSILQISNLGPVTLAEPEDIAGPCRQVISDAQKRSFSELNEKEVETPPKHRPLSWLPPGETSGRPSHLPTNNTASTVDRSMISAPVLTSTTNAKVALTEGVHCGKITTSGLATSSWHPKSGWVATEDAEDHAKDQATKLQEQKTRDGQILLPSQHSNGFHKMSKRSSKRSASINNALSKVKEALTSRLRQASDPQTYRSVFSRDKFVRLGDDCQPQSPVNDKPGRSGTEVQNLGADHSRALSDRGQVKRKPMQCQGHDIQDPPKEGKRPFLIEVDDSAKNGCYCADQEQHAVDFHFEDLETSFAKAVEKLDFRIRGDKVSLTSLSSIFQSGKNISAPNKTRIVQPTQGLARVPCLQLPANAGHPPQTLSQDSTSNKLATDQPSMGQCASCALSCSFGHAKAPAEVYSTPYQMDPVPSQELDNSDRAARAERIFSRGHLNPLASHPDLTKFAEQPSPTMTDPDVPPTPTPTKPKIPSYTETAGVQLTHTKPDLNDLEGAPIYSPSIGSLGQYDRNTPSSASASANFSSHKLGAASSRRPLLETPTRPPRRGTDRRHMASKNDHHRSRTFPNQASPNQAWHGPNKNDENRGSRPGIMQARNVSDGGEEKSERTLETRNQNLMSETHCVGDKIRSGLGANTSASRAIIESSDRNGTGWI